MNEIEKINQLVESITKGKGDIVPPPMKFDSLMVEETNKLVIEANQFALREAKMLADEMRELAKKAAQARLAGKVQDAMLLDKEIERLYKQGKAQGADEDELYAAEEEGRNSAGKAVREGKEINEDTVDAKTAISKLNKLFKGKTADLNYRNMVANIKKNPQGKFKVLAVGNKYSVVDDQDKVMGSWAAESRQESEEEDSFTIYVKPGFDVESLVDKIEAATGRDVGVGDDFINIYTKDPKIVKRAIEIIGKKNVTEVPGLEEAKIEVGDNDIVKAININNWEEIVGGEYEGKGQQITLDGQEYKVTGEVGDMVQLRPLGVREGYQGPGERHEAWKIYIDGEFFMKTKHPDSVIDLQIEPEWNVKDTEWDSDNNSIYVTTSSENEEQDEAQDAITSEVDPDDLPAIEEDILSEESTTVLHNLELDDIIHLAKGGYQQGLLKGTQRWSGSDLRGAAKMKWGLSYARSRDNLIDRLRKAGHDVRFVTGPRGLKVANISGRAKKPEPEKEQPQQLAASRTAPVIERKLSYAQRKALPKGDFVYPGERKYPIHDIAHARNALARVSTYGSPAEKERVRSAVYKRYPSLKESEVPDRGTEKEPKNPETVTSVSRMTEMSQEQKSALQKMAQELEMKFYELKRELRGTNFPQISLNNVDTVLDMLKGDVRDFVKHESVAPKSEADKIFESILAQKKNLIEEKLSFKTIVRELSTDVTREEVAKIVGYKEPFEDYSIDLVKNASIFGGAKDKGMELEWTATVDSSPRHGIDGIDVEVPAFELPVVVTIYPAQEDAEDQVKEVTLSIKNVKAVVDLREQPREHKNSLILEFAPVEIVLTGLDSAVVQFSTGV